MRVQPRAAGDAALVRRAALRLGLQAAAGTLAVLALMIAVLGVLLVRGAAADDGARLAVTAGNADDVIDPPGGMWIVLRARGAVAASARLPAGLPLTDALDRVAAGGAPEDTAITLGGHDYRIRTQARSDAQSAQVQVVLDEAPAEAQRTALLRDLCAAGLVGLVLTAAVGIGLGRRAVRPLETALAVQRRFVADAGHELRTPLTLLSTRAQILRSRLPGRDGRWRHRSTRWSPTRGGSPPSSTTCCSPPTPARLMRSPTSPTSRRPRSTRACSAPPTWA